MMCTYIVDVLNDVHFYQRCFQGADVLYAQFGSARLDEGPAADAHAGEGYGAMIGAAMDVEVDSLADDEEVALEAEEPKVRCKTLFKEVLRHSKTLFTKVLSTLKHGPPGLFPEAQG